MLKKGTLPTKTKQTNKKKKKNYDRAAVVASAYSDQDQQFSFLIVRCQPFVFYSHTVYLASLFNNFFYFCIYTFDTISLQDADFGLPDLGAFSFDSNTESIFFIHL